MPRSETTVAERNRAREHFQKKFATRAQNMARLAGLGRMIEGILKIADQVVRGLEETATLETLKKARVRIKPQEVKAAREALLPPGPERERLDLAVGLANKLAHFEYYDAKNKIDKYNAEYGLATPLTANSVKGWEFNAGGHLRDEEGAIDRITMWFDHTKDNLITEQFDYLEANGYLKAADQIIADGLDRIQKRVPALEIQTEELTMLRTFVRGEVKRPGEATF